MSNTQVKSYWSNEVCGTHSYIVSPNKDRMSPDFFLEVEKYRYRVEPFILDIGRFDELSGKRCLEIGVGAGTDHARIASMAGQAVGIDLTEAAVETCKNNLAWRGFSSELLVMDAENLDFDDCSFDYVWSWGVIHHSNDVQGVVNEVLRVLKPGGSFRGMIYNKHSLAVYRNWIKTSMIEKKLTWDLDEFISSHIESPGTKAYTISSAHQIFSSFSEVYLKRYVTESDVGRRLSLFKNLIPNCIGWYLSFECKK